MEIWADQSDQTLVFKILVFEADSRQVTLQTRGFSQSFYPSLGRLIPNPQIGSASLRLLYVDYTGDPDPLNT